jgi:hypothetical protein
MQGQHQARRKAPKLLGKRAPTTRNIKTKSPGQTMKDLKGEESKQGRKGSEEKGGGQGGFVVDLELMSTSMKKRGSGTQAAKKKAATKTKEDSVDKTKGRKKKATFTEPDEAGKKEDEKEVKACNRCIIGFVIRVDKGNNIKGGIDKKIAEGLAFLREYLDKSSQAGRIHG